MGTIYTKRGDKGETDLLDGTRVLKSDRRVAMYGELDELNSWIGWAIASMDCIKFAEDIPFLKNIQMRIFSMQALAACPKDNRQKFNVENISEEMIKEIEKEIDKADKILPVLKNFILPSGTQSSSAIHLCRTIARRAERKMIKYNDRNSGEIPAECIKYINRLSDYFFTLARKVNFLSKVEETVWKK